jgi:cutinase
MVSTFTLPRAAILIGILAVSSTARVHGLPVATSNDFIASRSSADPSSLNPRVEIPDALAKFPSGAVNQFLRLISSLPQGAAALDATGKILTPLQQGLALAAGVDTTSDDLAQSASCADVTVVYARGTTEPGNVGLVTGPPFLDALKEQLGGRSLAVQGVEYPATFAGFNKNGTDGVSSM